MPLTIGSNIASLQAQRQLGLASNQITSSYQRLSSGQRINSASDDAAGLAISEALQSSVRINTQAVKNLNDGISVLNIAKSALESLSQITIRQMELAEQSANGTYTNIQRRALHEEAKQLTDEYNRIIKTTEFNGLKLLDGSFKNVSFQAGIGQHATISVSIGVELLDNILTGESGTNLVGTGEFLVTSSFTGGSLGVGLATGDFD